MEVLVLAARVCCIILLACLYVAILIETVMQ